MKLLTCKNCSSDLPLTLLPNSYLENPSTLYMMIISIPPPNDIPGRDNFCYCFQYSQHYLATRSYSQTFYWLTNNKEFRDCNAKVHHLAKYFVDKALNSTEKKSKKNLKVVTFSFMNWLNKPRIQKFYKINY